MQVRKPKILSYLPYLFSFFRLFACTVILINGKKKQKNKKKQKEDAWTQLYYQCHCVICGRKAVEHMNNLQEVEKAHKQFMNENPNIQQLMRATHQHIVDLLFTIINNASQEGIDHCKYFVLGKMM